MRLARRGSEPTFARLLKDKLEPKLNLPRRGSWVTPRDHTRAAAERARGDENIVSRQPKVRVIENVEKLRAELHPELFGKLGVLCQCDVGVEEPGPSQRISSCVAECPHRFQSV